MDQSQRGIEARVEHMANQILSRRAALFDSWLRVLEVNVAKFVQPKRMDRRRCSGEVKQCHRAIDDFHRGGQARQNPTIRGARLLLFRRVASLGWRAVVLSESVQQREPRGVPHLVAEVPVALHTQHVQIDVAALRGVGAESESESVSAAFGNAL